MTQKPQNEWPLGKSTSYPQAYDNSLLQVITRQQARRLLPASDKYPQLCAAGMDIWYANELSWLNRDGKPQVARLVLTIPADSCMTVESKSLKLYLNSLNQAVFASQDSLLAQIQQDLQLKLETQVWLHCEPVNFGAAFHLGAPLPQDDAARHADWVKQALPEGLATSDAVICLDELPIACQEYRPAPELLGNRPGGDVRQETFYTHLFRSCCPVTQQPDWATIWLQYTGVAIDSASLLQYLVSYRLHEGFHEACIEQIFMDVYLACSPMYLCVYGSFAPRGGIAIHPWRSSRSEFG